MTFVRAARVFVLVSLLAGAAALPTALASSDSPTAEELLAALSYDPKKARAKSAAAKASAKAVPAPAKPLLSKETAPAAPKAEDPEKKKEKTVERTVKGTISFVLKNRMGVQFSSSEEAGGEDLNLKVGPKLKLHQAKSLKDLGTGDSVEVRYVETYKDPEPDRQGSQRTVLSMVATDVRLLSKANPEALKS